MPPRLVAPAAALLLWVLPGAASPASLAAMLPANGRFEFRVPSLSGGYLSSEDFKGKIVILDVWATWCSPCRLVIPHLIKMQDKLKAKGVAVVGLSADDMSEDGQGLEPIKEFVKENRINYPIGMMDGDTFMRIMSLTGADSGEAFTIPTTLILDRAGGVLKTYTGYFKGQEQEIEALVNGIITSEAEPRKKP